jgi:hypothetical protein
MATQKDRWEFIHTFMKYAPMVGNEHEGDLRRKALRLLSLAATHKRLENELTNGYKDKNGNQDHEQTAQAIAKRERVDAQMEKLASIGYGALTVYVRLGGGQREIYIP